MNITDLAATFLAGTPDGVIIADAQGTIRYWNAACERIFGFTGGEACGQSLDIIIPPKLRTRHWQGWQETMRTGRTRYGAGDLLSVPALREDGTRSLCRVLDPAVPRRRRDDHGHGRHHARRHETLRGAQGAAQGSGQPRGGGG